MRYRVTFEFDTAQERDDWGNVLNNDPSRWYWKELLKSVETCDDHIDWSSFTLEEKSGWITTPLDSI